MEIYKTGENCFVRCNSMRKMNRRDFLKLTSTVALSVSAVGLLSSCSGGGEHPESSKPSENAGSGSSSSSSSSASGSSSSSSASSSESTSSSAAQPEPLKIIWKIKDNGDGTAILVGYDEAGERPAGEITLPTEWSGRKIVGLDNGLGGKITKLIVPGTYKDVNYYGSDVLQELILQEGVEIVSGFRASKNLWNVRLPSTLKEVGDRAFTYCEKLTAITFPVGLKRIGQYAFCGTGLTKVTLHDTIADYGEQAFAECRDLTEVMVHSINPGWRMFMGCTSLTKVRLSPYMTYLANDMFNGCTALQEISLPKNLTKIGSGAFCGCTVLRQITIPVTVTTIEGYAFEKTAITKVTIPNGVKELGWNVFGDCFNLKAVYIPVSMERICNYAFAGCRSLTDVYYQGGQQQWVLIRIDDYNTMLQAAQLHYYSSPASMGVI